MKPNLTKEQQAGAAIASKLAVADELSDFMDRVAARLDLYEPKVEAKGNKPAPKKSETPAEMPVVEQRPMKHY